ncbi:MAG: hypothetical protein MMC23_008790 [Stictis urceolatum]|nr:hypothetical protein [Stictis urceolata]
MAPKLFRKPLTLLSTHHARTPLLRRLPLPSLLIITLLVLVNVVAWIVAGIVLHFSPGLSGTAVLAYTLGLRHALDADHISAIDLMTRRLVAEGKEGYSVGTWFSLGHSTIVIITSLVVAGTAAAVSKRFDSFSRVGGIIGTSVSASFLLLLGLINLYILYKLVAEMRRLLRTPAPRTSDPTLTPNTNHPTSTSTSIPNPSTPSVPSRPTPTTLPPTQQPFQIHGAGCLFHLFKRLFTLIDAPWKMYPLGLLFGLGFDTSSEIALLGISSIQASRGTSIWYILLFPVLFTAGMCLLDTIDGALMLALYTSTGFAKDVIGVMYFSVVLTGITVLVAGVIGVVQGLMLVVNVAEPRGAFWEGVGKVGEHFDVVGGAICGCFLVLGGLSVVVYGPWRRWVEKGRVGGEVVRGEEGEVEGRDSVTSSLMEGEEGGIAREEHAGGGERVEAVDKKVDSPV